MSLQERIPRQDNWWIAPLPKAGHRLVHWRPSPTSGVLQVETLQSKDGFLHARIYLSPKERQVPTIVIGHPSVIGVYAWRDHKSAHPLRHDASTPLLETSLAWPDDFSWLNSAQGIRDEKTMYYVRPTSFVLTDVDFIHSTDVPIKIKKFTNVFDGTEFHHITSPNEWETMLLGTELYGLVTTNSAIYVSSHPEYEFVHLKDSVPGEW